MKTEDGKDLLEVIKEGIEKLEETATITWSSRGKLSSVEKFSLAIQIAIVDNINLYKALGYTTSDSFTAQFRKLITGKTNKPISMYWENYILYLAGYKKCSKCGKIKLLRDFHRDNSAATKRQCVCIDCSKNMHINDKGYNQLYYKENKAKQQKQQLDRRKETVLHIIDVMIREGKLPECEICGYKENWAALDFHHINPDLERPKWAKLYRPSQYLLGVSKELAEERYLAEIDNLQLLCSNCHREIHNPIWATLNLK